MGFAGDRLWAGVCRIWEEEERNEEKMRRGMRFIGDGRKKSGMGLGGR